MEPIRARRSVRHYTWGVAAGVVAGLAFHQFGASEEGSLLLGLLIAAGPVTWGFFDAALGQEEVLRIDDAGLFDQRLGIGTIPWEQIVSVRRSAQGLFVTLRDPAALGIERTLWRRMNQPLGQGPETFSVLVRLGGLDVKAERILAAIDERLS